MGGGGDGWWVVVWWVEDRWYILPYQSSPLPRPFQILELREASLHKDSSLRASPLMVYAPDMSSVMIHALSPWGRRWVAAVGSGEMEATSVGHGKGSCMRIPKYLVPSTTLRNDYSNVQ